MEVSNEDGNMLYQNENGNILTSLSGETDFIVYTISIPIKSEELETRIGEKERKKI